MVNRTKSSKCLTGKTAIITGANQGIGYHTAVEFAKRGCRTILACRNQEKADEAKAKIIEITGNENVVVKLLNLEFLDSVREFCKDINETESRLDILVNNAGSAYLQNRKTVDGLQLEMATNHFAPFLLTNLLLDLLKKSAPSRIVNVASSMSKFICNLDLDKINEFTGSMDSMLYARTKLCNVYFTIELAKRLEGTGITTYTLHPGAIYTEFNRNYAVVDLTAKYFFLSPEEGAQTTIYCALEDDIEKYNGRYFDDCKLQSAFVGEKHEKKARKLWEISEKLVGMTN